MLKLINAISIEDFRSFNKKDVLLQETTCLVGANESGKTNLLDAINLAKVGDESSLEDKQVLRESDIRKNSEKSLKRELPIIKYELSLDLVKNSILKRLIQSIKIDSLILVRNGNSLSLELPSLPEDIKLIKNITDLPIQMTYGPVPSESPEESEKKNKSKKEIPPYDLSANAFTILTKEMEENYDISLQSLLSAQQIQILTLSDADEVFSSTLLKEINNNLKLFFWSYDKDKYSLPDLVTLEEIKTNLVNKPVIKALFKLGDIEEDQILNLIEGRSDTDYQNFFDTLSKKITEKIRSKWRTNQEITLQVVHKTDHLLINVSEPGYSIEPQFRSEGMRWFLAFLIGMIAETNDLSGYVIIIDEPALHLHPGGQKDVLQEINLLSENNQIIYSTHSHFMIDKRFKNRVRFVIKTQENGYSLTDVREPTQQEIFKDPLLRLSLGFNYSDLGLINESNILVEGLFDKRVIQCFSDWVNGCGFTSLNLNDISVISCDAASEIVKQARMLKDNGLKCISLYDADQGGETASKANTIQKPEEKISIRDITSISKSTMEDVLPDGVFKDSIKTWELYDNEAFKNPASPRMSHVDKKIDEYLNSKKLEGEDARNERNRLKHSLEDLMVENLNKYLNQKTSIDAELKNLNKLNEILISKTTNKVLQ